MPVNYEDWQATCDTLHAHTQILGKLAAKLAPQEPQLQHAALRLTARGWETGPLPAPDGSGSLVVVLDLHAHEAVVEHSYGRTQRIPLTPNRAVAAVTRDLLAAVGVEITMTPQETAWSTPLDEDTEHRTYDASQVEAYFDAATHAALVLAAFRAPWRGGKTPVNAWWGSFDLATNLFSGNPADPPSDEFVFRNSMDVQEIAVGWWPGDHRYPRAAFYGYTHPPSESWPGADGWNAELGEYILDWDDVVASTSPFETALEFLRRVARHACATCGWDPTLAASLDGEPPPVR
jgi:Family of unknown function (DUF5996)